MTDRTHLVLGNFWLLVALILKLGQKPSPAWEGHFRFFGVGGDIGPVLYWAMIIVCLLAGIALVSHKGRS